MADELARLVIRADERGVKSTTADLNALTSATGKAEKAIDGMAGATGRGTSAFGRLATGTTSPASVARSVSMLASEATGATASLARMAGAAGGIGAALTGVGIVAGTVALALRPIIAAGSEYTNIANKLRVVTSTTAETAAAQQALFRLSQQTGQSFASVVQTYGRAALSARELGATQAQMVTATGAVSKALQISGASASEAAAASTQLAQALASGTLAGDELKSILENAPVLARAIAAGLGVSVGELRKMGSEGKLLSRDVFAAILRQTGEIDAQFEEIGNTVEKSTQRWEDAWTRAVASIDMKLGASSKFATLLDIISGTLTLGPGTVIGAILGANANAADGASDSVAGRLKRERDAAARQDAELARIQQAAANNPLFGRMGGGFGPGIGQQANAFRFSGLFADAVNADLPSVADIIPKKTKAELRAAAAEARRLAEEASRAHREVVEQSLRDDAAVFKVAAQTHAVNVAKAVESAFSIPKTLLSAAADMSGAPAVAKLAELGGSTTTKAVKLTRTALDALTSVTGAAQAELAKVRDDALAQIRAGKLDTVNPNATLVGKGERATDRGNIDKGTATGKDPFAAAIRGAQDAATQAQAIATAFATGLQNTFATGFANLFSRGLSSVQDFARSMRDTILRAFSEVLASSITKRLLAALGGNGGLTGAVSSGGGILGSLGSLGGLLGGAGSAGKLGNITKGASSGGVGLGALAGIGGGALLAGSAIGQSAGTGAGALGGAAGGALAGLAFGGPLGALVGGVGGLIGGLFGGRSKAAKQQQAKRALEDEAAKFSEDIITETMRATGDTLGAERRELIARQKAEMDAARAKFGASSRQVSELAKLQELQLANLDKGSSDMASGTYLAPSGFSAAAYRFKAGRPTASEMSQTITTGPVTIMVPPGTSAEMAQDIVRQLQGLATAQGMTPTDWSRVDVQ